MRQRLLIKNRLLNKSDDLAKTGMIATMGATLYSGFAKGKMAKMIHPWAGVAMVVFSYWHHMVNLRKKQTRKK